MNSLDIGISELEKSKNKKDATFNYAIESALEDLDEIRDKFKRLCE